MRAGALPNDREIADDSAGHLALVEASAAPASSSAASRVHPSLTSAATLARERTIPVAEALTDLVPSGRLQRGTNVSVHGVGARSFALALAGEAVRAGSFLAIVAPPSFGLAACLDFDIPLRRVVQFTLSEPTIWGQVVASIIEGFDLVMLADSHSVGGRQARQLVARNRERGSILLRVGGRPWVDAADLRFDVHEPRWSGLGTGHGHLQQRQVEVQVAGRRHPGRPRAHQLLLPAAGGGVAAVLPEPVAPGERFAGSDIDALIEAARAAEGDRTGEGVDEGRLDAIA